MPPKPVQTLVKPKSELGFLQCMKRLHKDMTMLYETGTHSDLKIVCRGVEFQVHRAILFPRSEFFQACCKSGFKEGQESIIALPDDDPIAVKLALRQIYTRCPTVVRDHYSTNDDANFSTLIEIWKLADKYQLPDLAMQCLWFIEDIPNGELLRLRSGDKWKEDLVCGLSNIKGLVGLEKERHLNGRMQDVILCLLMHSTGVGGFGVEAEARLINDPEVSVELLKYMAKKFWETKASCSDRFQKQTIAQTTNGIEE